jgi:hypothetical protein
MRQALPRAKFNSSRLVRRLAAGAAQEIPGSRQDFAERLGQWLDVTDAIALFAAVSSANAAITADGTSRARAGAPPTGRVPGSANCSGRGVGAAPSPTAALDAEVDRLRASIAESIATDSAFRAPRGPNALQQAGAVADVGDFGPWHRAYRAHQRRMEAAIAPMRASVRDALGRQCPALRPLAEIDAALEKALEARERLLMSRVPQLLEKRFEQLRARHAGEAAGAPAGDWLARFRSDLQDILQAELDVRLQPVEGLIEAIRSNS